MNTTNVRTTGIDDSYDVHVVLLTSLAPAASEASRAATLKPTRDVIMTRAAIFTLNTCALVDHCNNN